MAHLVPLKPYAAPVPRSQSLCDQPTKTMSAFPTQDPSLTPTPRPIHSRELVRQNSDPTSETPAPQAHQIREDRGPWIRLPDVELPPKVRFSFDSAGIVKIQNPILRLTRLSYLHTKTMLAELQVSKPKAKILLMIKFMWIPVNVIYVITFLMHLQCTKGCLVHLMTGQTSRVV